MEITEEQRERMRRNREKALEIQAAKRKEREEAASEAADVKMVTPTKRIYRENEGSDRKRQKTPEAGDKIEEEEGGNVELEDFEVGASPFVSKKEAMKKYLLPEGTLAVCKFVEKENPRNKGFSAMKLYHRSEIRRRGRERFGGLRGLVDERIAREEKRFERDLEKTKNIFGS